MRQRFFSHVTTWSDHMTSLGALSGRSTREKQSCTDVLESRQGPSQTYKEESVDI